MTTGRVQRRIERLLDQVEAAADAGDWEGVDRIAQEVLYLDPGNADALHFKEAANRALGGGDEVDAHDTPLSKASATPSTAEPTSFADGRYVVKRFLGEGGKKKVF